MIEFKLCRDSILPPLNQLQMAAKIEYPDDPHECGIKAMKVTKYQTQTKYAAEYAKIIDKCYTKFANVKYDKCTVPDRSYEMTIVMN